MRKIVTTILSVIFVLSLCLAISCNGCNGCKSCNKDGSAEENPDPVVTLSKDKYAFEQGDEYVFTATVENTDEKAVFTSSDSSVVEVSADGKAVCKKAGAAVITAKAGGASDQLAVTVSDEYRPVIETREKGAVSVFTGATYRANISVTYKGEEVALDNSRFKYDSANKAVATVDENGFVTAVAVGETVIKISAEYRFYNIYAEYTVKVNAENYVITDSPRYKLTTLEVPDGELKTTGKITATAVLDKVKQENPELTFISDNEGVATVDNSGNITAVGEGEARVTVTFTKGENSYKATAVVEVSKPQIATALSFEYEIGNELILPEYDIADFAKENIIGVYEGDLNAYEDGKINKQIIIGSPEYKAIIVETRLARYQVSLRVINAKIASKADMDNITDKLAKFSAGDGDKDGYYFDGYIEFVNDIFYNGEYKGFADLTSLENDGSKNGFKGKINGKGKTISGLKFTAENTAFTYALISGGEIYDLKFANCSTSAVATAVVAIKLGDARVSGVTVEAELITDGIPAAIAQSRGVAFSQIIGSNAKMDGVEITNKVANAMPFTSLFGTLNGVADTVFENCTAINSDDRVYGVVNGEGVEIRYLNDGITNFKTYGLYLVSKGYKLSENESKEATCAESGREVYRKDGETSVLVTVPAKGHQIENGACKVCSLGLTQKETECDVKDGMNFAEFVKTEDESDDFVSVAYDGTEIGLSGGVLNFLKEDASLNQKTYRVTTKKHIYDINLTVWSLLISDEEELGMVNDYLVRNIVGSLSNSATGYYKLDEDIVMTKDITNANRAQYSLGYISDTVATPVMKVVYDGNGHKISNWVAVNQMCSLICNTSDETVVKNLTIYGSVGGTGDISKGLLVSRNHGGRFENIEAVLSVNSAGKADENSSSLLGSTFGSWGDKMVISVDNVRIYAGNEAVTSAENCYNPALLSGWNCEVDKFNGKKLTSDGKETETTALDIKNLTVVGFNAIVSNTVKYTPVNYTLYKTVQEVAAFARTAENITIYKNSAEYYGNITITPLADKDVGLNAASGAIEVDFAEFMPSGKTLDRVLQGVFDAGATNGKITFGKSDTSDKPKAYYLVDTDGAYYSINLTVWNALVKTENDWKNINSSLTQITDASGNTTDYSGYIKLLNDITVTEPVTSANRDKFVIGYGDLNPQGKYPLVLDGNGKTIKDWQSDYQLSGLIYASNAGTIERK